MPTKNDSELIYEVFFSGIKELVKATASIIVLALIALEAESEEESEIAAKIRKT